MRLQAVYLLFLSLFSGNICGCVTTSNEQENLDAVLWVQTSSEFSAATIGTYAAASTALQRIVAESPTGGDRMAVVMDVDETILDGSRYQAQSVLDDVGNQAETMDQYFALREGTAIPGSVNFTKAGQDL